MTAFEGFMVMTTNKAVLFHGHYWCSPEWFPRSQVVVTEGDGMEVILVAKPWICGQNSLVEFAERDCPPPEEGEEDAG